MKRALTSLIVAVLWLGPGVGAASADPSPADLAAARRLFAAALDAEDRGRFKDALALYQKVVAIAVSPPLYYHLGICHEALGELVEALNTFDLASQLAVQRREADVERESKAKIAALQKKVPTLLVRLPEGAHDVTIAVDDRPVSAALAGTRVPVNPGEHRVIVRAASHERTFDKTIRFGEGEAHEVDADLGSKLKPTDTPPPLPKLFEVLAPPPKAPLPPAPALVPSYAPAIALFGSAALCGAASLATGLFAHADHVRYQDLNVNPPLASLEDRKALYDRGRALAISSTVLTLTMAALGAIGIYFTVKPPRKPAPNVAFSLGDRRAFVTLGGAL